MTTEFGCVVVGVSSSLASLAALRRGVLEARRDGRTPVAVAAWEPPDGETLYAKRPDRAWARMWEDKARLRLSRAFDEALGSVPTDLHVVRRVVRDEPGSALCAIAHRPDDLLIVARRRPRPACVKPSGMADASMSTSSKSQAPACSTTPGRATTSTSAKVSRTSGTDLARIHHRRRPCRSRAEREGASSARRRQNRSRPLRVVERSGAPERTQPAHQAPRGTGERCSRTGAPREAVGRSTRGEAALGSSRPRTHRARQQASARRPRWGGRRVVATASTSAGQFGYDARFARSA